MYRTSFRCLHLLRLYRAYRTLAGAWLSEGSVNLDVALLKSRKSEDGSETLYGG